jgi:glycosyltransferase involved in cell wall biosynthesis
VTVVTRVGRHSEPILASGISLVPIALKRGGLNPIVEMRSLHQIAKIYRRLQPDIVHHVAMKPVLYGSFAARRAGTPCVVNALAGLGYLIASNEGKARLMRPWVKGACRALLSRPGSWLICQNPDDLETLVASGLIRRDHAVVIRGSGVDLSKFVPTPEIGGPPLVVLPARLLRDKGVADFVDAARLVKEHEVSTRFALVGDPDPANPTSIAQTALRRWVAEGVIEHWGWVDDMVAVFRQSAIVCLPSYREGLPKALLEAAACGRAIVTTNVPGCREVVGHGDNGLLVPPGDVKALAEALLRLVRDPALRAQMGRRGRVRATQEFSDQSAISETLALYEKCIQR